MATCNHHLPGFRTTCITVCALYVVLGASILLRGVRASLQGFAVPAPILDSPHYQDAIFWVYSHMIVIGVIIGVVGITAESERQKRWFARAMLAANLYYVVLDVRASDSPLGTALYHGPASLIPVFIGVATAALFAHLSFCRAAR